MNGNCIARSASRETSSASAGSVISGDPDEDGFLSGSGQEIESDDLRCTERRSVALMTEKQSSCSVSTQTGEISSFQTYSQTFRSAPFICNFFRKNLNS